MFLGLRLSSISFLKYFKARGKNESIFHGKREKHCSLVINQDDKS